MRLTWFFLLLCLLLFAFHQNVMHFWCLNSASKFNVCDNNWWRFNSAGILGSVFLTKEMREKKTSRDGMHFCWCRVNLVNCEGQCAFLFSFIGIGRWEKVVCWVNVWGLGVMIAWCVHRWFAAFLRRSRRYRRRFCDKIYAEVNYHRNDSANLACLLLLLSHQIM